MKVTSARSYQPVLASAAPQAAAKSEDPKDPKDSAETGKDGDGIKEGAKKAIIASASAAGGLTGGYFLGSMAGAMLSNVSQLSQFSNYGPYVGAGAGALWGAALYLKNNDDAISAVVRGSATATLGGTIGLFAGAYLGPALASATGMGSYALNGPLATAVTGALTGFAIQQRGRDTSASQVVKGLASTSFGATAGWMLGGAATAGLRALTSMSSGALSLGPAFGAVSGGLIGLAVYLNKDRIFDDPYGY